HAFNVAATAAPVKMGLAAAAANYRAGEDAMHERNVRREGLVVSLLGVGITIAGLMLAIRQIGGKRRVLSKVILSILAAVRVFLRSRSPTALYRPGRPSSRMTVRDSPTV